MTDWSHVTCGLIVIDKRAQRQIRTCHLRAPFVFEARGHMLFGACHRHVQRVRDALALAGVPTYD